MFRQTDQNIHVTGLVKDVFYILEVLEFLARFYLNRFDGTLDGLPGKSSLNRTKNDAMLEDFNIGRTMKS